MLDFAKVSDVADEVNLFHIYLLTLVLAWETQSCLSQMAFISLLPQQIENSLKNLHPKCNHSQLQAWSCKNCCSCFKVNYFKAFQFQKLYVMLRVGTMWTSPDCRANLTPANQVFNIIPFFSQSSQVSSAVSAPQFYISLVKRQSSAVSCISVPLPLLGLANCEKWQCSCTHPQWACETQIVTNTIIEYQVERDCKDHLVQPFLVKARSRHGLARCPAEP